MRNSRVYTLECLKKVDACEPWVPPPVNTHEAAAIEEVIHLARPEIFVTADVVGIPAYHVLQCDLPSQQPRQPFRSLEFEDANRMGTMSENVDQPAVRPWIRMTLTRTGCLFQMALGIQKLNNLEVCGTSLLVNQTLMRMTL